MRKELESKLAKVFGVPWGTPTYEDLLLLWDEAEGDIVILKHQLDVLKREHATLTSQRDASWDVLNRIEDYLDCALTDKEIYATMSTTAVDVLTAVLKLTKTV